MTRHNFARAIRFFCLLAGMAPSVLAADEPIKPADERAKFIRIDRDAAGEPLALQTAIARYQSAEPGQEKLQVDLIGAVHVGDRAYYEALNKRFEGYDAVLYELVAPPGTRVPKGSKPGAHPIAVVQNGLKDLLGLEHQLELIDYTKANLVHADMSPEDFSKSMSDRGESFTSMFFRMMGQGLAQQSKRQAKGKSGELDIMAALFEKDRPSAMKRVLADQFDELEGAMDVLEGPQGSTLIGERNKVALKKLAEEIAAGKKKIAIFYGAGHMSDIEKRLKTDFKLDRASQEWLSAWKLDKPAAPPAEVKKPAA